MTAEQNFLAIIEEAAAVRGMAASTLCKYALGDPHLPRRLRAGKTVTLRKVDRVLRYIDATNVYYPEARQLRW